MFELLVNGSKGADPISQLRNGLFAQAWSAVLGADLSQLEIFLTSDPEDSRSSYRITSENFNSVMGAFNLIQTCDKTEQCVIQMALLSTHDGLNLILTYNHS